MTLGRLTAIRRYPVKGLPGQPLETLALTAGRPIPHDRRFAVCNGDAPFEEGRPQWIRRVNFLQVANNAEMVTVEAEHRPEEAWLRLRRDGAEIFAGDLRLRADAERLEEVLAGLVGTDALRGPPRLVEIPADVPPGDPGQAFADTAPPHISIINLATVRSLGETVDASLDERRFRGNLYIEAAPWAEFDWIGHTIAVGDARLEVRSRIGRCAATNVNPATGDRDQNLPLALKKAFGHNDCGVYAVVTRGGEMAVGAELRPATG
jgi:uncharacterized protein